MLLISLFHRFTSPNHVSIHAGGPLMISPQLLLKSHESSCVSPRQDSPLNTRSRWVGLVGVLPLSALPTGLPTAAHCLLSSSSSLSDLMTDAPDSSVEIHHWKPWLFLLFSSCCLPSHTLTEHY